MSRLRATATPGAVLLGTCAFWANLLGDHQLSEQLGLRAIEAAGPGASGEAAFGWFALVHSRWYTGQRNSAREADLVVKRLAIRYPNRFLGAFMLAWPNTIVAFEPAAAPDQVETARAMLGAPANETAEAFFCVLEGSAWFGAGDQPRAVSAWRRAVQLGAAANNRNVEGFALAMLAARARETDEELQRATFRDTLRRLDEQPLFWPFQNIALAGLAQWWTTDRENLETAARIVGFLEHNDPGAHQSIADLRASISETVRHHPLSDRWLEDGRATSRAELINQCINRLNNPST